MKHFTLLIIFICNFTFSQTKIKGQVIDYDTTIPVAFAKITYNSKTFLTDWEGKFTLEVSDFKKPVYVTYKGYYEKSSYPVNNGKLFVIKMITNINIKNNEIYSDQKVNLLIKKVYDNQSKNDPKKHYLTFNIRITNTYK